MKYRYIFAACALLLPPLANAEGFPAYYVQELENGQLTSKVTCKVLFTKDSPEINHRIRQSDGFTDLNGNPVVSGIILSPRLFVDSGWQPGDSCASSTAVKRIPAPLTQMPK